MTHIATMLWLSVVLPAAASSPPAASASAAPPKAADMVEPEVTPFSTHVFGYIDAQFHELAFTTGFSEEERAIIPREVREEVDTLSLNLNLMLLGDVLERYHWYVNLGAINAADPGRGDLPLGIRNAWVEVPLYRDLLNVRLGKTYRRFGLYNEILDAAPTFPGVEAPEFLVPGQTLLTRTTNVMVHGTWLLGNHRLIYTLHTGTDERVNNEIPVGGDLRLALSDVLLVGSSGYWSGGEANPTRVVGAGQRQGGVANWMARDEYTVVGGYLQLTWAGILFQIEYWHAAHAGQRNPAEVLKLSAAELNERQRRRFFGGAPTPTLDDVRVRARYKVQTAWGRLAYEIAVGGQATLTPYLHVDWVSDPESIEGPALGGSETGLSDDGQFYRSAVGVVFRPGPQVAFKAELNPHMQKVEDRNTVFVPFQISISYFWSLEDAP